MKQKTSLILLVLFAFTAFSCEKSEFNEEIAQTELAQQAVDDSDVSVNGKVKKFTFITKGDFKLKEYGTRGTTYLNDETNTMTDLWLFDYKDGVLQQQLHQQNADEDWGKPVMMLTHGLHHIYFVASRGADPIVNTSDHTIIFSTPRDTFWSDYEVEVKSTSNGNRAVTLNRVATRLQLAINDRVPANVANITITPSTWYFGLDYRTAEACPEKQKAITIGIPESKRDTDEPLVLGIYGLSPSAEWKTDVELTATDTSGNTISTATIADAPMQRNRQTQFSGRLFSSEDGFQLSLDSDWNEPVFGTW